jgi:predicted nucleic acid-binding protein
VTWLVDTNIISEVRKGPRCHPAVAAWWARVDDGELFLSVLVLGEIRRGVEALRPRDPAQAAAIDAWLGGLTTAFSARILGIDARVAERWGRIAVLRSVPVIDALMAATAAVHGLTLVTRNQRDVEGLGVRVLDPFVSPR